MPSRSTRSATSGATYDPNASRSLGDAYAHPWLLLLFAIGAIVMRAAGCTYNDIVDREIDAEVARTRGRPLPSGQITPKAALRFMIVLARADRDRGTCEVVRLPRPHMQHDRAARRIGGEREHLVARLDGEHVDLGAGGGQELGLPGRGRSPGTARSGRLLVCDQSGARSMIQPGHPIPSGRLWKGWR